MNCFACNAAISVAPGERVGFRDECPSCGTDLHACRNCAHWDPGAHNQCREPNAEWVSDRERANRCEYFAPGGRPGSRGASKQEDAKRQLESLFKK